MPNADIEQRHISLELRQIQFHIEALRYMTYCAVLMNFISILGIGYGIWLLLEEIDY